MLWDGEEPVEPPVAFGGDTDKDALPEDVGIGVEVGAKLEAVAEGGCVGFFLSSQSLMRSRRRPWPAGEPLLPGEAIRPPAPTRLWSLGLRRAHSTHHIRSD